MIFEARIRRHLRAAVMRTELDAAAVVVIVCV